MKGKVVNKFNHKPPHYETVAFVGMDIEALAADALTIKPLQRALITSGLFIEFLVNEAFYE